MCERGRLEVVWHAATSSCMSCSTCCCCCCCCPICCLTSHLPRQQSKSRKSNYNAKKKRKRERKKRRRFLLCHSTISICVIMRKIKALHIICPTSPHLLSATALPHSPFPLSAYVSACCGSLHFDCCHSRCLAQSVLQQTAP